MVDKVDITYYSDGEDITEEVLNRPIGEIDDNIDNLISLVNEDDPFPQYARNDDDDPFPQYSRLDATDPFPQYVRDDEDDPFPQYARNDDEDPFPQYTSSDDTILYAITLG